MRWRMPGVSRNGVRKPVGAAGATGAAAAPPIATELGSRIALAASAETRCSACAAPTTPAAPWNRSPANCRKKRRRARSAPSPGGPTGSVWGGRASFGSVNRVQASSGSSVLDDAGDAASFQAVATLEEAELDQEAQADDLALETLDELDRALDRAARREQVVHDQDLLARLDRVAVDLERVGPVL